MRKSYSLFILILFLISIVVYPACKNDRTTYAQAFSVSKNQQVYFAKSNLQYCPSTGTWSFQQNAYDSIGQSNESIDEQYSGNIDLFGWGATGAKNIYPYCYDCDNFLYGNGHNSIANTDLDFGFAISSQLGSGYRMFTNSEIHYLLMFRKNAKKLFGYGSINNKKGLFILPDDWISPENINFISSPDYGFTNQYNWYWSIGDKQNYNYNNFSLEEWNIMESFGAVFLPITGMRYGNGIIHANTSGHYWTSSYYGEEYANCLCFFEKDLFLEGNFDRCCGLAIRLIKDAKQ